MTDMMNPTNIFSPLNPIGPLSLWDDDESVVEAVKVCTDTACNSGCDGFGIVVIVAISIVIFLIALLFLR